MKNTLLLTALLTFSLPAVAGGTHGASHHSWAQIGQPGKAKQVTRTVVIDMTDNMRFTPSQVTVKAGETLKFVVKNSGKFKHEMVLGTQKELEDHYELMKKHPEMDHTDPNMVTLAAGKTGEIIWRFTKAGTVDFACLQPGHYEAGMKGAVTVQR